MFQRILLSKGDPMRSTLLKKVSSDPSLHVKGYGVLAHSQIKAKVQSYLKQYGEMAAKGNWSSLYHYNANGVFNAMLKTLADFEDHKIKPEPEVAEPAFAKETKQASAEEFIGALMATCQSARMAKQAKPEVLDSSLLYLKLQADPQDPNFLTMSFFSPKLRAQEGSNGLSYRVEVGEKGTNQIRRDLNKLIVPQLRGDVLEDDHALLEKVIYRLRNIVLDSAMEYQDLGDTQKAQWKNVVRMDITKYQDVSVRIQEQGEAEEKVASKKAAKAASKVKVQVVLHGKKLSYDIEELQEMLADPKMYKDADNLPKWLMLALVGDTKSGYGDKGFDMAFQKGMELIKQWIASPRVEKLTLAERPGKSHLLTLSIVK
jgi:hypothetical protein